MHCADCTICFLHLQKGGREERGVVAEGNRRTLRGERELNKEGKKKKTRDRDKNKGEKRRGREHKGGEGKDRGGRRRRKASIAGSVVSGGDSHGYGWTKSFIKPCQCLESPEMSPSLIPPNSPTMLLPSWAWSHGPRPVMSDKSKSQSA